MCHHTYRLFLMLLGLVTSSCGPNPSSSDLSSLTGDSYQGQKYYLGWGAANRGDPSSMHNEVRYDVLHTHDIFISDAGGDYSGSKITGSTVNQSTIQQSWDQIQSQMNSEDMYVQYSSGHGYSSGLAVGVSYDQMRDFALSLPAQEIIIFTMACQSGGLVRSFEARRSEWSNFRDQGRTLFVMASSRQDTNSSTGPGHDPDEPGGPSGSAGSAFGHALWKALIGYADGFIDGIKDGYLSLGEIIEYTKWKTNRVGGHMPVLTGSYSEALLMNRVPSQEFIDSVENSTENMTEQEVAAQVESLERSFRL
jgi:hypothetical protein